MDWRDQIKSPATFRGVPFWVTQAEHATGRRNVHHKYPLKETEPVYIEDMGRDGRSFPVEGYVVGADYLAARNALLAAIEEPGSGELVHPHYGTRRVAVASCRVRETTGEGGMAQFAIEFVETQTAPSQPSSVQDSAGKLKATALDAIAAVSADFVATWITSPLTGSVVGSLRSGALAMSNALATVTLATQTLAQVQALIDDFTADAATLVNAPEDLVADQAAILQALGDGLLESATVNPCAALLALYDFNPGVRPPATTPSRVIEQDNFDAAQVLTQRLVVIQAALVAIAQTFDSYDTAIATRETITDLLDEQADVASDAVYPLLVQLRADLVNAVPGDTLELARIVSYTPPATLPSLVLAHRLYGDIELEADLVARNRTRNPTFLTGGTELEVLSRG